MKNLLFIIFIVSAINIQCQPNPNLLTQTEFDNIKINGISLKSIMDSNGSPTIIENLLGISNSKEIDSDGDFNHFDYDGLRIGFSAMMSDDRSFVLSAFRITDNRASITIKNTTFTIGDNISLLGNVIFSVSTDGSNSIIFKIAANYNNYIAIDFNQTTNIITKIIYIEIT